MKPDVFVPTGATRRWVDELFRAAGSSGHEAALAADHLVGANLAGHDSHGVGMVPIYVRSLQAGELQLNRSIAIVSDTGSMLVVDGQRGLGQSIAHQTMALAIERARTHGVAIAGLRMSHHIGRVGHWAEQAIAAGMASIHFTNVVSRPLVSPHGGAQGRFGTNPLTVGLPRRDAPPILLDFATSAIAAGKVRVAWTSGGRVPEGVLLDPEGNPTTDPTVMYQEPLGALLTAAGHKGYALAMVCDLLGAALFGGHTPQPRHLRKPAIYNNMLVIVFDPARFGALEHYERETAEFIDYVRAARLAPGADAIRTPGEMERRFRVERAERFPLDAGTIAQLDEAAAAVSAMSGRTLVPASTLAAAD